MAKILQFLSPRFKGPFFLTPGTDGVDETFDIVSYRTGKVAASVRYWYERDQAYELATVILIALNANFRSISKTHRGISELLNRFQRQYPGPFELRFEPLSSESFGSFEIVDLTSKQVVHEEYGNRQSTREIDARVLLEALSNLVSDLR